MPAAFPQVSLCSCRRCDWSILRMIMRGGVRLRPFGTALEDYFGSNPTGVATLPGHPAPPMSGASGGVLMIMCCRDDFFGPLCLLVGPCQLGQERGTL